MKTIPRDLLLSHHAAAIPQLDALRRAAVNDATPIPARKLFHALFYPQRTVWIGLAAAWVAIVILHFSQHPPERPANLDTIARYATNWSAHQAKLNALLTQTDSYR